MSRLGGSGFGVRVGFPRVSGDEPAASESMSPELAFSPRERG